MTTITIPRRARTVRELLKKARKSNVILRSPEGDEFVLAEIDDFNREIELTQANKAFMKLLDARARQQKTVSWEQAMSSLGLGNSKRSRRTAGNHS